jgi:ABC-type transport system substrate-binding protein
MAYNLFNMSSVNFGPSTIAQINQSGLLTPSQQAIGIMSNTAWPIHVTNPYQIVFRLQAPFYGFLGTLVQFEGMLFDSQYVLDHGGFGTPTAFNTNFNQNPIPGTGPYEVTKVSENNFVSFTQNPTYWGKSLSAAQIAASPYLDPGHVKNVIINYKSDDVSRYTDLSSGAAQIAAIQSANWNLVTQNPNQYSYFTLPSAASLMIAIAMNVHVYPTNITLVRQAIAHAINYSAINATAFAGQLGPLVGPEYPGWKQFYDLGNLPPYQYNLTLATQDILAAKLTSVPTFTFRIPAGCTFCSEIAQIVQGDLAPLNITVSIEVLQSGSYSAPYGGYSTNVQNAAQIGQLAILGGEDWASFLASDNWAYVVGNQSGWGNWAAYYNPTVQACSNAFTSSVNATLIQSLCKSAQQQIYNDAPYAWVGVDRLLDGGGSVVWKSGVIKSFFIEPAWGGEDTAPVFNTVTFG